MKIAQVIKENRPKTAYQRAAEKYGVSYKYVCEIAAGKRKAIRGKAFLVKNYLLEEIQKLQNNAS